MLHFKRMPTRIPAIFYGDCCAISDGYYMFLRYKNRPHRRDEQDKKITHNCRTIIMQWTNILHQINLTKTVENTEDDYITTCSHKNLF